MRHLGASDGVIFLPRCQWSENLRRSSVKHEYPNKQPEENLKAPVLKCSPRVIKIPVVYCDTNRLLPREH